MFPPKKENKPPVEISIGMGKASPTGAPPKPKLSPLMGGKDSSQPDPSNPDPNASPTTGSISPEESSFHDQSQSCSQCSNYDESANNGLGQCTKGVQVDYSNSDPGASWCKFFAAGNEEMTEPQGGSPIEETKEGEPPSASPRRLP